MQVETELVGECHILLKTTSNRWVTFESLNECSSHQICNTKYFTSKAMFVVFSRVKSSEFH